MILCIQHATKMQCIRKHNMNPYDAIRPEYSVLHLYCTWLAWVKHKYHMHFSFQYLQSTMVLTARLQKNKNMFFCPANCPNKSNAFSHHLPAQRVLWLCEAGFATKRLILILIGHLGDQRESVSEKIHGPCKAYDKLSRIAGWWLVVFTILKNISQWDGLSHILWKTKNVWNILKPPTRLFFSSWFLRMLKIMFKIIGLNTAILFMFVSKGVLQQIKGTRRGRGAACLYMAVRTRPRQTWSWAGILENAERGTTCQKIWHFMYNKQVSLGFWQMHL